MLQSTQQLLLSTPHAWILGELFDCYSLIALLLETKEDYTAQSLSNYLIEGIFLLLF
jgi:hypothetical protein